MTTSDDVLFYSRCKPYGVDLQQVAIDHRCVFFGHFLDRGEAPYLAEDPSSFLVPPDADDAEWTRYHRESKGNRSVQSQNRRLARERVGPGSIAMVPWPSRGFIYCGRVSGPFRVSYCAARYADAEAAFVAKGYDCDEIRASGEIAQGWEVDRWVALPIPLVPAWIRRSLFGRSTYGVVAANADAPETPLKTIDRLMRRWEAGEGFEPRAWTTDLAEVRRRLRESVTPGLFEGLIVALLQLEEPEVSWLGVGGSGDGGIDGLAADDDGNVVALLQCKWAWAGESVLTESPIWAGQTKPTRKVFAHMAGRTDRPAGIDQSLALDEIARLVLKHSGRLPLAITLRIGPGAVTIGP